MVDKNTVVRVKNRDSGKVGYKVPELNIRRQFEPKEVKELTVDELRQLSYKKGGKTILTNHLVILDNDELVNELIGKVEPEYYYSEEDVKELLLNGSLDQLMDCLDFAPLGVIELVKKIAVDLKINDLSKRQAIMDKTGFNVNGAIEINEASAEDDEEKEVVQKTRRAAPVSHTNDKQETSGRRTNLPKYQVTSIKQ